MKKVFHFDSPRERYICDAVIVWCFDSRFDLGFRKFLKREGIQHPDPVKIAGGAKCLATPELESDREFVLDQIRKSMSLHGATRAILMLHSDCGAYGGLAAFGNDLAKERANHRTDLYLATKTLQQAIPGLEVTPYFVDFEGVWTLDEAATVLA
jgi:hypothetical protein